MRLIFLLLMVLSLGGCASADRRQFVDVKSPDRMNDYQEQLWAEDDFLFIQVRQMPGANISGFDPILHGGNLYLEKRVVRTGGASPQLFRLDLSYLKLPKDWTERVYWVEGRRHTTVTEVFLSGDPDGEAILRRKVHVSASPLTLPVPR